MSTFFPIAFANEEVRLLTAILLGAGFGFSLERAGFGNARKLAAQFYLYDMAVFKVMFTAILVSMVGLFSLEYAGLVDLGRLWINPSYFPSQAVGGVLLGVGFVISGYCPGTSVVSAASGRLDGIVALGGVFLGTAVFAVAMDVLPGLEALYTAGSGEVILLHDLFGIPAPVLALILVAGALAAFIGAEKVEEVMKERREALDDTPRVRERPPGQVRPRRRPGRGGLCQPGPGPGGRAWWEPWSCSSGCPGLSPAHGPGRVHHPRGSGGHDPRPPRYRNR